MNNIKFDLENYGIRWSDLKLLLDKSNSNVIVNGFMLEWDYTVDDGIVFVSARLKKIRGW